MMCKLVYSAVDHLTCSAILAANPNKEASTFVFSVFGVPELLHSNQGREFENELIRELQRVFCYKKTHTTPYRPQGNSVLNRFHCTMHNMLATYCDAAQYNLADMLPFVQMAHNTACHCLFSDAALSYVP